MSSPEARKGQCYVIGKYGKDQLELGSRTRRRPIKLDYAAASILKKEIIDAPSKWGLHEK